MSEEMRRIRRKMRGPDAHEARASMGRETADSEEEDDIRRAWYTGFLGSRKRRIDLKIDQQFSDAWFAMALLLTVVGLIFKISALLVIAAALLVIVAVSWLWNRLAPFGLVYERHFSLRRAFVGETVEMELVAANRKFLPLSWLRVNDVVPVDLPLEGLDISRRMDTNQGELSTFWALKWYERATQSYTIKATSRGFFHYGPSTIETGDLFGLFRTTQKSTDEQVLIVYPKIVAMTSLGLPAKEPFGDLRTPRFVFEDPVRTVGIRDYRPEDDFRRVHWKASARRQTLQARVLEPASSHNLIVCLNVATLSRHWKGVISEVLEQAVSVAASIAYYSLEQRWPTGLLANGALPRSDQAIKVLPGRSPNQITAVLEMLAAVTPFATSDIESLLALESPRLPWGSTLVVITAIITEDLAATLLDLQAMGRRIVLLSLADEQPPEILKDLLIYQVPRGDMPALGLEQPIAGEQGSLSPQQLQAQAIQLAGTHLSPSIVASNSTVDASPGERLSP